MKDLEKRIKELEDAIKWCLENGANYQKDGKKFYDTGCGCCAYEIKPDEFPKVIAELYTSGELDK